MGSIIEDIVEDEIKKKRRALKRKHELEKRKRQKAMEKERLIKEREKLAREKLEQEKRQKGEKKKDRIPEYKRKIEASLQTQQSVQTGYESLPAGFVVEHKPEEPSAEEQNKEPIQQPIPQQPPPQQIEQPPKPPFQFADESAPVQAAPSPPKAPDTFGEIRKLMDTGTKEEIQNHIQGAIRNGKVVYLPGINPSKFKFPDYGYRRLIEHVIESKDFLRIIIDTEDMQGVTFVTLSGLIRPKEDPEDEKDDKVIPAELTLRGLEGLCEALYSGTAELDPYENEWKHLNKLLECFAQPDVKGKVRTWNIETEKTKIKLTAVNNGEAWIYRKMKEQG